MNDQSVVVPGSRSLSRSRLRDLSLDQSYSTASHDLISGFYMPCLEAASHYDRAVGYFRSSLFAVVGVALSDFALRNGCFRLICSPYLERSDIEAIEHGLEIRAGMERRLSQEIDQILGRPENRPAVVLLATLIATGAMDVKLACRPQHAGMFHAKIGIFHDGEDAVSFVGSSNETFSAWDTQGNHEAFEVFRSWEGDGERVQRHRDYFERLWQGSEVGVETYDFPEYPKSRLLELADSQGVQHSIEMVRQHFGLLSRNGIGHPVVVPEGRRTLYPHQVSVINSWMASNNRGIVKHATGAGKTVTALEAARRWISTGCTALIVVPSAILAEQWRKEATEELGADTAFLDAGAGFGRHRWEGELADFTRDLPELGPRVVIATMQTASTKSFLRKVQSGPHLLLVADEVHRIGSPQHSRILEIDAGGRLGLSATPERFGDPSGTRLILDYFGQPLEPLFELGDAIRAGRLVPYEYHVHLVTLTDTEQDVWDEMTARIQRAYGRLPTGSDGEKLVTEQFKLLLIQRARIVKKACLKVDLARDLVRAEYRDGDRWLVYCDDQAQLYSVVEALRESDLSVFEYHSAMLGARVETLTYFQERGGVLVAIRCLDEGVDIPLVNRALILASSSNPREFIQRRGRVLRVAPGKYSATVHDALVVPHGDYSANDPKSAIVRTEIRRSLEFSRNARNESVRHELEIVSRRTGIQRLEGVEFDFEEPDEEETNAGT